MHATASWGNRSRRRDPAALRFCSLRVCANAANAARSLERARTLVERITNIVRLCRYMFMDSDMPVIYTSKQTHTLPYDESARTFNYSKYLTIAVAQLD